MTTRNLIDEQNFHLADHGTWALGTLIWLPILFVIVLVCALIAWALWAEDERLGAAVALGVAALFIIGTLLPGIGMYPYKGEYHQWREVSGTVEKIDKRLLPNGDSMEEKYVVIFDGSSRQFGCADTRCASIEEGDALTLRCKRAWEWAATDGFDCRYVSYERQP